MSILRSRYFFIIEALIRKRLKVRYRGSILGIYWSLMSPLMMTGMYTAIFGAVFSEYYDNSAINYILAAFTGLVVADFYGASTSQALSSIVGAGGLLNKIRLPVSAFPVSEIGANLVQLVLGPLPLLVLVTVLVSGRPIRVFLLIFPLISLLLFAIGVGLIVSVLYVFFRDLSYFYKLLVFGLRMGTPIFYPADIVPEQVLFIMRFNPLYSVIEVVRSLSLTADPVNWSLLAYSTSLSSLIFLIGCFFFRTTQSRFIDLL